MSEGAGSMEPTIVPTKARVSRELFMSTAWVLTGLSFLFLAFRLAVRLRTFHRFQLDDVLVIAAWLMFLASTILFQVKVGSLYWQYDIVAGKVPLTPEFVDNYATFMPHIVTWTILYYCCLWSVKYSFLVFFRQLNSKNKAHRVWWWVVFGITTAGLIASIGDLNWKCAINDISFIMTACSTEREVRYSDRAFYANATADVVTDILILSIPIIILWNVQISWKKKLVLFGIFSFTVLIMIVAIIRVAMVRPDPNVIQNASIDWLYLWCGVEMGVAIIVASIASFRQLFISSKHRDDYGRVDVSSGRKGLLSYFSLLSWSVASRKPSKAHMGFSDDARSNPLARSDSLTQIVPLQHVHIHQSFEVVSHSAPSSKDGKPEPYHNNFS